VFEDERDIPFAEYEISVKFPESWSPSKISSFIEFVDYFRSEEKITDIDKIFKAFEDTNPLEDK
jgi:hypothetical protein